MTNLRTISAVGVLAILAVAVCLIPAGAHLFEMRNKLALSPDSYMTVQAIYVRLRRGPPSPAAIVRRV